MAIISYRGKKASAIVELRMIISVRTALGTAPRLHRRGQQTNIFLLPWDSSKNHTIVIEVEKKTIGLC